MVPKLTLKEIKERVKERYGYNGRFIGISKLAEDIYYFLIDEETLRRHKVNIFSNEDIIKISLNTILKNILDSKLKKFSGVVGQALRVLHDRGLIEIIKKKHYGSKTLYYIKIR